MIRKFLVIVGTVLSVSGSAFAAHPLITDDTGTQGARKFLLEVNGELSQDKGRNAGVEVHETGAELAAAFSAGIFDNVDLVMGAPWARSQLKEDGLLTGDENGLGDLLLELKWRFMEHKGFSMAVKPGLTLPTGNENRGLGNGKASYGVTLIATQELKPFTIHANAAYTRNEFKLDADKESNRKNIWHGSLAATCEVVKDLQLVANIGMETNSDSGSNTWPAFILGGAVYTVTENLDLDLGVKGGLTGPETNISYLAGIAYRF